MSAKSAATLHSYKYSPPKTPSLQDFTQQTANKFALNFTTVLSCFNVSTDRGENREWEVDNRSCYDDLDNRHSGTKMSV